MEAEVDGALELQIRSLQLHESAQENLLRAQNLINRVCLGDAGDHFEEQHLIRCQFIAGFENESKCFQNFNKKIAGFVHFRTLVHRWVS